MSRKRQCRGCGAYLQSDDPNLLGYLPAHLLVDNTKELICQRCFRLKHYGQNTMVQNAFDADHIVHGAVEWAEGIILVLDLMDLEASIPENILELTMDKPVIIAVNKIDLLPPKTSVVEAKMWVSMRLKTLNAKSIHMVSGNTGAGIPELSEVITESNERKWIIVGVTNVGKSTIIGRLLQEQKRPVTSLPTTSTIPGTTSGRLEWKLAKNKLLSDTPGLVPEGRLSDLVCLDCAATLIPAKRLNVQVYELGEKSALVIPGLAAVKPCTQVVKAVLVGITASEVSWQRTNASKVSDWLSRGCVQCQISNWQTINITLPINHDLVVHGLGWISARQGTFDCELTIPDGVKYSIRPNLIGGKKYFN